MKASEPQKVENKHLESLKEILPEKSKTKKCTYMKFLTMQFPEISFTISIPRISCDIRNSYSAHRVLPIMRRIPLPLTDTISKQVPCNNTNSIRK